MQCVLLSAVLLVLLKSAVHAGLCSAPHANRLTISVGSRRNETGHWVVTGEVLNRDPQANLTGARELLVDVVHDSEVCEHGDTVQLRASVARPETTATATATAPEDYELVPGLGYYKLHSRALNWNDARELCIQENAHLLIINSDDETNAVKKMLANKPRIENADTLAYAHIGIHDLFVEGKWVTVFGDSLPSLGYAKWESGEPNLGTKENCGFIGMAATLYDGPCSWKLMFICEHNSQ